MHHHIELITHGTVYVIHVPVSGNDWTLLITNMCTLTMMLSPRPQKTLIREFISTRVLLPIQWLDNSLKLTVTVTVVLHMLLYTCKQLCSSWPGL